VWSLSWLFLRFWRFISVLTRFSISTEIICILTIVLGKCCSLVANKPVHILRIIRDVSYRMLYKGTTMTINTLSGTQYAYTRDTMTTCRRCRKGIATAVNTPVAIHSCAGVALNSIEINMVIYVIVIMRVVH
jgi:uncharacterized membrane protein